MSIENLSEYARQCKIDNYEDQMDKEIKDLRRYFWLNDYDELETELTDKDCLEIIEFMNKHDLQLDYIDLSECENKNDIIRELGFVC